MPRKLMRGCSVQGCKNLVERDGDIYCKEHKPIEEKKYNTFLRGYDANERYDSRWRKVRNIYIKSHPFCEECLKENKVIKATLVHHKIPVDRDKTKKYELSNLESVCASCHQKLHDKLDKKVWRF